MRRIIVLAIAAVIVSAGGARADKTADAFIDPSSVLGGANGFTNANSTNLAAKTYSVGAAKLSGCKLKLQFKGLAGFVDGEKMLCLAGADANIGAGFWGNSIVLHVPYSSLSGKAGTKGDTADIGCGDLDALSANSTIDCYKFDALYDPAALCTGAGVLSWVPNATFVLGSESTDGLVGLCQYNATGLRLPAPSTPLVARDGISTPLKP